MVVERFGYHFALYLAPIWPHLWPHLGTFGAILAHLGAMFTLLGPILAASWPIFAYRGSILAPLGAILASCWPNLPPSWPIFFFGGGRVVPRSAVTQDTLTNSLAIAMQTGILSQSMRHRSQPRHHTATPESRLCGLFLEWHAHPFSLPA